MSNKIMNLSDETKVRIIEEYERWEGKQHGSRDEAHIKKKGQFFTPPALTIRMLEKFDNLEGRVLDPTCGAGRTSCSGSDCRS